MNDLDQFRADFALVWSAERRHLSAAELEKYPAAKDYAGQYVRRHLKDGAAMQEMKTMLKGMADQIRRDQARGERIKAEVRAGRAK